MITTERKTEIVTGIETLKKTIARLAVDPTAKATLTEHINYLEGAGSYMINQMDKVERDSETLLSSLRDLRQHIRAKLEPKEDQPDPADE